MPPDQLFPVAVSAHMLDHTSLWDNTLLDEAGKADSIDMAVLDARHSAH